MPGEELDAIVGVDTHRDTRTAALAAMADRQRATLVITADATGCARLLA